MNRLCDAPGVTGTDYGPCPGEPTVAASGGYRSTNHDRPCQLEANRPSQTPTVKEHATDVPDIGGRCPLSARVINGVGGAYVHDRTFGGSLRPRLTLKIRAVGSAGDHNA